MIYFDNAATTQMSDVAIEALIKVTKENYGNASSLYQYGRTSHKILEDSRRIIAECIGAEPCEIYFTSGGTESDNWAVWQGRCSSIEKIITSVIEHHAVLEPIKRLSDEGKKTYFIPVDNNCKIDDAILKSQLDGRKSFVSFMLQNNETGTIQNIKELSSIIHLDNKDSIFHTDAVQAIGHMDINVHELGVDMLSASAHKFNGPKGIGFLYIKKGCSVEAYIKGGGQERLYRSGTENIASIYSMAKALEENVNQIEKNAEHISALERYFFELLDSSGVKYFINADSVYRATGIINISIDGIDGEGLLNMLDMQNICISVGSACNSKSKEHSYVLKEMGISQSQIESSVRISIGRYNTKNDVEALVRNIDRFSKLSELAKR